MVVMFAKRKFSSAMADDPAIGNAGIDEVKQIIYGIDR